MLTIMALSSVASAETVASVLMVEGQVYIGDDGSEQAATVGMEIDRDDAIVVDLDASLYVLLHNNRVVALGEDIEIPAGRISGIDDPAVDASVKEQLAQILSPSDRERLGPMVSQAEGIGGWHGRMTAAVAPVRGGAPERGSSKKMAAPAQPEMAREEAAVEDPYAGGLSLDATPTVPMPSLASLVVAYQPDGAESKCTRKWAKKLVKGGAATVELMVKTDDAGQIQAAFIDLGEPLPACLSEALVGQTIDPANPIVELRLK